MGKLPEGSYDPQTPPSSTEDVEGLTVQVDWTQEEEVRAKRK